ncbi:hypothetical protein CF319_g5366 [Tilletia indica]|nr:hypothetical protein CF319_g5366 [Tilletia indica]
MSAIVPSPSIATDSGPPYGVHIFQLASANFYIPLDQTPIHLATTSNVLEYREEIFTMVSSARNAQYPELILHPPYHEWVLRMASLEWLMHIHERCDMVIDTLWLAINIFNRYIAMVHPPPSDYDTIGLSALCIAGKYEEARHPKYRNLVRLVDGDIVSRAALLRAEHGILTALKFDFGRYVSPSLCIWHIAMIDEYWMEPRCVAKVIVESTITELDFLSCPAFKLGAAALFLGLTMCGGHWKAIYIERTGLSENDLRPVANRMLRMFRHDDYQRTFVFRKYSSSGHSHVSLSIRTWALIHTL